MSVELLWHIGEDVDFGIAIVVWYFLQPIFVDHLISSITHEWEIFFVLTYFSERQLQLDCVMCCCVLLSVTGCCSSLCQFYSLHDSWLENVHFKWFCCFCRDNSDSHTLLEMPPISIWHKLLPCSWCMYLFWWLYTSIQHLHWIWLHIRTHYDAIQQINSTVWNSSTKKKKLHNTDVLHCQLIN